MARRQKLVGEVDLHLKELAAACDPFRTRMSLCTIHIEVCMDSVGS